MAAKKLEAIDKQNELIAAEQAASDAATAADKAAREAADKASALAAAQVRLLDHYCLLVGNAIGVVFRRHSTGTATRRWCS